MNLNPVSLGRAFASVFLFAVASAAQQGPMDLAPLSPSEAERQQMYRLLDDLRAAVRANDWAEAARIADRLNVMVAVKRNVTRQASPSMELAHVEILAGTNPITRAQYLPRLASAAFAAHQWEKADKYAREALEAAAKGEFWWTGDAIHHGNIVLGRLALMKKDRQTAVERLLAAGKAPGTLRLAAFGPNLALARDLLQAGERDAVVKYLELCHELWKTDRGKLAEWIVLIKGGLTPSFPNVD